VRIANRQLWGRSQANLSTEAGTAASASVQIMPEAPPRLAKIFTVLTIAALHQGTYATIPNYL
jgi:hypothetical protein